jgi:hypothetical protein
MSNINDVFTECKSCIEALRQGKEGCFLVRGVHDNIDIQRYLHSIQERIPLNMDEAVHKAINKHFIDVFKWPVRNGVFCVAMTKPTPGMNNLGYGRSFLMFPCSEFEFVCDEDIFDLYEHYRNYLTSNPNAETSDLRDVQA